MKNITIPVKNGTIKSYSFAVDDDLQTVLIDSFSQHANQIIGQIANDINGLEFLYGWSLVRFTSEDASIVLEVPDHKSFPPKWCRNLSPALEAMVYHQFVPESFGLRSDIPAMSDTVLVGERFHELPMFLTRSEKSGQDDRHSGWFMASSADDADISNEECLNIMSVYEAVMNAPYLFKYISMPVGSQVVFDNETPHFLYKNKPIIPIDNSLVATERLMTET